MSSPAEGVSQFDLGVTSYLEWTLDILLFWNLISSQELTRSEHALETNRDHDLLNRPHPVGGGRPLDDVDHSRCVPRDPQVRWHSAGPRPDHASFVGPPAQAGARRNPAASGVRKAPAAVRVSADRKRR